MRAIFQRRSVPAAFVCGNVRLFHGGPTAALLMPKTYFEVLNVPVEAKLDSAVLKANHRELQAAVHPDVKSTDANVGAFQQAAAELGDDASATASKAFKVLDSDYQRCRYISQLVRSARSGALAKEQGIAGDSVEASTEDDKSCGKMPPEFLLDVMELNEVVFTDHTDSPDGQKAFAEAKETVTQRCVAEYEVCLEAWEKGGHDMVTLVKTAQSGVGTDTLAPPTDAEKAFHAALRRWTYFENLRNHIRELED